MTQIVRTKGNFCDFHGKIEWERPCSKVVGGLQQHKITNLKCGNFHEYRSGFGQCRSLHQNVDHHCDYHSGKDDVAVVDDDQMFLKRKCAVSRA